VLLGALAACAHDPVREPVETLNETTGVTIATLSSPITLVQTGLLAFHKRASFAYLGPVEWNRMGNRRYGLWIHIAPGNDRQVADVREPGAVTLILDDGALDMTPLDPMLLGSEAYSPVVNWGQSVYFSLTVESLRRLGASRYIGLDFRASGQSILRFKPTDDAHAALSDYVNARLGNSG